MIFDCINLAVKYHRNSFDKSFVPYINHPLSVMRYFTDINLQSIAVLHDTLEDSECSKEEILKVSNQEVLDNVIVLTKRTQEDYSKYIERLEEYPLACLVKVADILDNCSIQRQYKNDEITNKKYSDAFGVLDRYIGIHSYSGYYEKNPIINKDYKHIQSLLNRFWRR